MLHQHLGGLLMDIMRYDQEIICLGRFPADGGVKNVDCVLDCGGERVEVVWCVKVLFSMSDEKQAMAWMRGEG